MFQYKKHLFDGVNYTAVKTPCGEILLTSLLALLKQWLRKLHFMCNKARELFFHQVNLLFHQFPRDHLHPFQLLLHLQRWASQNQGARIKIERCLRLLGQRDLLELDKEALSPLPPWEPTSQPLSDTVVSGRLVLIMCQVSKFHLTFTIIQNHSEMKKNLWGSWSRLEEKENMLKGTLSCC